jgi:hypothetical protein
MTNDYEIVIGNDDRNVSFVKPGARWEGYVKTELKENVDKICLFFDVDLPEQRNIMKTWEVKYCCLLVQMPPSQKSSCLTEVLAQLPKIKYIEE